MTIRLIAFLFLFFALTPTESMAQTSEPDLCYTGPPGSVGVGICQPGTRVTTATGWSCEGEVTPVAEIPDNTIDEDCNGTLLSTAPCGADPRHEVMPESHGIDWQTALGTVLIAVAAIAVFWMVRALRR